MTSTSSLQAQVIELTPEDYIRLPNPPRLIDVRSAFEYDRFRAPNALNLSLPRLLMGRLPMLQNRVLPHWFRSLPKSEPIAVICLTAHRSPIAAQQLTQDGFTQVFNITGGMMAWRQEGFPICKGRNAQSIG